MSLLLLVTLQQVQADALGLLTLWGTLCLTFSHCEPALPGPFPSGQLSSPSALSLCRSCALPHPAFQPLPQIALCTLSLH